MSGWSAAVDTSASVSRLPIGRWLFTHLAVYLFVAVFSGLAFIAGVTLYAHLSPAALSDKLPVAMPVNGETSARVEHSPANLRP